MEPAVLVIIGVTIVIILGILLVTNTIPNPFFSKKKSEPTSEPDYDTETTETPSETSGTTKTPKPNTPTKTPKPNTPTKTPKLEVPKLSGRYTIENVRNAGTRYSYVAANADLDEKKYYHPFLFDLALGTVWVGSRWEIKNIVGNIYTIENIYRRNFSQKQNSYLSVNWNKDDLVYFWDKPDNTTCQWIISPAGTGYTIESVYKRQNKIENSYLNVHNTNKDNFNLYLWKNPRDTICQFYIEKALHYEY
jgi:hypothetical protein